MNSIFNIKDLHDPYSKRWQGALGKLVEAGFPELFADPVGTWGKEIPHPVVAFYPVKYKALLQLTKGPTRFAALCSRAKIFFALANGPAKAVWGTVPKFESADHTRVVCGIWVERSPREGSGSLMDDRPLVPFTPGEWDWEVFDNVSQHAAFQDAVQDYVASGDSRWACISTEGDLAYERFKLADGDWLRETLTMDGDRIEVGPAGPAGDQDLFSAIRREVEVRHRWSAFFLAESLDLPDQVVIQEDGAILDQINTMIEALLPLYWPMVLQSYRS